MKFRAVSRHLMRGMGWSLWANACVMQVLMTERVAVAIERPHYALGRSGGMIP